MRASTYLFALATVAMGITNVVWGDFETAHQPIQAFGDNVPGRALFAYVTATWLVLGGAALLFERTRRAGAAALAVLYLIFGLFWVPRFVTAPQVLGHGAGVYIGVLGGLCQQLILTAACLILMHRNERVAQWTFAVSAIVFGLGHLTGMRATADMVPQYMPLGTNFWAALTGVCFILAGIAIASGFLDVLAARLLTIMLFIFSVLALGPIIVVYPHSHIAWGVNAYNLTAVGAVWVLASALALRRRTSQT